MGAKYIAICFVLTVWMIVRQCYLDVHLFLMIDINGFAMNSKEDGKPKETSRLNT